MEDYIKNFESYNDVVVYDFQLGEGGIGDNTKFFMFVLECCMKDKKRLYYKKYNIYIENFFKLKYDIMYADEDFIKKLNNPEIIKTYMLYTNMNYDYSVKMNEVFYFTDEVIINSKSLFPQDITNYISLHLRLGDKFLETDSQYVFVKEDVRHFSEENILSFIEKNNNKKIFFCSDNMSYKLKLKEKYDNLIITNCHIGHSSLSNTTKKQVLDAITEFYILSNSTHIYMASYSGFSIMAAKFKNIPITQL